MEACGALERRASRPDRPLLGALACDPASTSPGAGTSLHWSQRRSRYRDIAFAASLLFLPAISAGRFLCPSAGALTVISHFTVSHACMLLRVPACALKG